MNKIETPEEQTLIDYALECLDTCRDMGPAHEDWASDDLVRGRMLLRDKFENFTRIQADLAAAKEELRWRIIESTGFRRERDEAREELAALKERDANFNAVRELLAEDVVFVGGFIHYEGHPYLGIDVFCSDTFAWGCADAESFAEHEAPRILAIHKALGHHGITAWCGRRRNCEPMREYLNKFPEYADIARRLDEEFPMTEEDNAARIQEALPEVTK